MSPFSIAVVLILTILFIVMSIIPLLPGQTDMDSSKHTQKVKTKGAH
jgi:hypothetical protein